MQKFSIITHFATEETPWKIYIRFEM